MECARCGLTGLIALLLLVACPAFDATGQNAVSIPDAGLEANLRSLLKKPAGPLLDTDLAGITYVWGVQPVYDLTGLEYCIALDSLALGGAVSDLAPLSQLTTLASVSLNIGELESLEPISGLPNLTRLRLNLGTVPDLSPLAGVASLTRLLLFSNNIPSLEKLGELTQLKELYLIDDGISVLPDLSALTALETLLIEHNEIVDLSPVTSLPALAYLSAHHNQISAIPSLANLPNLGTLNLSHNLIEDLTPLNTVVRVTSVNLNRNRICSLAPLLQSQPASLLSIGLRGNPISGETCASEVEALESAGIRVGDICAASCGIPCLPPGGDIVPVPDRALSNAIGDAVGDRGATEFDQNTLASICTLTVENVSELQGIQYCTNLRSLSLLNPENPPVESLAQLSSLASLETLILINCDTDISTLSAIPALKQLTLKRCSKANISSLSGSPALEELTISDSYFFDQLPDAAPATRLDQLTRLTITDSAFNDTSVLANLTSLTDLDLSNNNVQDISPLASLTNLQRLEISNTGTEVTTCGFYTFWDGYNAVRDISAVASLAHLKVLLLDNIMTYSDGGELCSKTSFDARNQVHDLGPLEHLAELEFVGLANNKICDLDPLVRNPDLGSNTIINLSGNGLAQEACQIEVPALEARGVNFYGVTCNGTCDVPEGQREGDGEGGGQPMSPLAALSGFATLDANGDGVLSALEAGNGFDTLDDDQDGTVTVAELRQLLGMQAGPVHAADTNGNGSVSLSELLRCVQLFNLGALQCGNLEDGYEAGMSDRDCVPHSLDYAPQDWVISLPEILRLIQLHNGGYHSCDSGEDGYCPGPI